jgi:hypothetical protein
MKNRLSWFALSICFFAGCVPVALFAQGTASITGTVTDASSARTGALTALRLRMKVATIW